MTRQWQRRSVRITCGPTDTQSPILFEFEYVEGDVLGALAVHRTVRMPWTRARWSVTHVPTGRHVSTANTERLARRFVREIAPLADWEYLRDLGGQGLDFWNAMHEAMLRAHDGQYVMEIRL